MDNVRAQRCRDVDERDRRMTELRWGPRPGTFAAGGALLAAGAVGLIAAGDGEGRVIATTLIIGVLVAMFAGWRMRNRLRASVAGLVVASVSGSRVIPWSRVRRVEVVGHKRLGTVTRTLEIDLDDDELLVFGRIDLGSDPAEVAARLVRIRTGGP